MTSLLETSPTPPKTAHPPCESTVGGDHPLCKSQNRDKTRQPPDPFIPLVKPIGRPDRTISVDRLIGGGARVRMGPASRAAEPSRRPGIDAMAAMFDGAGLAPGRMERAVLIISR